MGDEAGEGKSLPIVSVVDKSEKYQIKVTSVPDKGIENAIGEVMSVDFLGALKNLINVALNEVLGNTSAAATEKTDSRVTYPNNGSTTWSISHVHFRLERIEGRMHECFLLLHAGRHSRPGESGFTDNVVRADRSHWRRGTSKSNKALGGTDCVCWKALQGCCKVKKSCSYRRSSQRRRWTKTARKGSLTSLAQAAEETSRNRDGDIFHLKSLKAAGLGESLCGVD